MRILIDCDGVLCDFLTPIVDAINKRQGRKGDGCFTADAVDRWDFWGALNVDRDTKRHVIRHVIEAPGFCVELNAFPGAVAQVKNLARAHDVYFVTTPWASSQTWVFERNQWLRKHFGSTLGGRVVQTKHKELLRGDILVDDKPETVERWQLENPRGVGLIWDRPSNRAVASPCLRASSWSSVLDTAARLSAWREGGAPNEAPDA